MDKCNCSDGYEEARRKITGANKNIKYCYIQGTTGPAGIQGEQGIQGEPGLLL